MVSQVSTGVAGLDNILAGGYLAGSPTLLIGQPGCGKTLFLLAFLAAGVAEGQVTVCATCTEAPERLVGYMEALGHPARSWVEAGRLRILDLRPVRGEQVVGSFDLSAIVARLDAALGRNGTSETEGRLAIDDLNRLAYAFDERGNARDATYDLFQSLRESGVTTLISAADSPQTRASLADYTADSVITLRQTVANRLMTRILRVEKQRGVGHGTNEYPFMIAADGPILMPVTHLVSGGRAITRQQMVSTGMPGLDSMLGGGFYKGSSVMISGSSGTGKSTLAGQLALGLTRQGMTGALYTMEQTAAELLHDWAGVGIDLQAAQADGKLDIRRVRAADRGLEEHLIRIARHIHESNIGFVLIDPVSAFNDIGDPVAVKTMLIRLVDVCKTAGVLVLFTELLSEANNATLSNMELSSLLDAWLRLELLRQGDEYIRLLRVLKSRGAKTSGQIKEFRISTQGLSIEDPYLGDGAFVFGAEKLIRRQADQHKARMLADSLDRLNRRIVVLERDYEARSTQAAFEREEALAALRSEIEEVERRLAALREDGDSIGARRGL